MECHILILLTSVEGCQLTRDVLVYLNVCYYKVIKHCFTTGAAFSAITSPSYFKDVFSPNLTFTVSLGCQKCQLGHLEDKNNFGEVTKNRIAATSSLSNY